MSNQENEKMTFEQKMKRLESIVATLEKGELELEQSLLLFEEGITLLNNLETELATAKTRVEFVLDARKVEEE